MERDASKPVVLRMVVLVVVIVVVVVLLVAGEGYLNLHVNATKSLCIALR